MTALRVLLMFALVGLVAEPARAHTIGLRGGGGSTNVCTEGGDPSAEWVPLVFNGTTGFFEAEFLNNCGVEIFSIDFQFGDDALMVTHPPGAVAPSGNEENIFDSLQTSFAGEFGPAFRFFSSEGNFIDCTTCGIDFQESAFPLSQLVSTPNFILFVDAHIEDVAAFVRLVDVNQDPNPVPEPASLLLLGTGLGGVAAAVKRRRRR